MAIRRLKRGGKAVLVIDIRDARLPKGRVRVNASVQTVQHAKAEEKELRENLAKYGTLTAPEEAGGMTLGQYWEELYEGGTLLGHTKATQLAYTSVWSRKDVGLKALVGHVPLESIDAMRITKMRNAIVAQKRSPRPALILLKALLTDAYEVSKALVKRVEFPRGIIKDSKKLHDAPSNDEAKVLLDNATGWLRIALVLSLHCGLRMGEVRALRVGDIDLERGFVFVRRAFSENDLGEVKNRSQRYIPLPSTAASFLADALRGFPRESLVASDKRGRPLRRQEVLRQYKKFRARIGMQLEAFHKTRHFFATQLLATGADLETARSLTGHHSVSSFERYIHTGDVRRREAIDRVALGTGWALTSEIDEKADKN